MMKKYFIVADVHGYFDEMMEALHKAGFNINDPDHVFVSLGDLHDRGPKSRECIEFAMNLPKERRILVRGNHEDLMREMVLTATIHQYDRTNGTVDTMRQITGERFDAIALMEMTKSNNIWWNYFYETVNYVEIGDFILVHGWIPLNIVRDKMSAAPRYEVNEDWRNGNWGAARWFNGMDAWSKGASIPHKTIICGHWDTAWGNQILHNFPDNLAQNMYYIPFIDEGIIALDACTALTKMINCIVIEN